MPEPVASASVATAPRSRRARPRTWLAILTALLTLAGTGLVATPAGAAERAPRVFGVSPDIVFHGRGWGHGVGMSQHGARGRALAGQTTEEILAHYYQGTTLGSVGPATSIRVLVLTGFVASAAKPATITGRGGSWTIDGIAKTFAADAKLTLVPTSSGSSSYSLKVVSAAGATLHSGTAAGALTIRPAAAASLLQLNSKPSTYDTYRGLLRVHLTSKVAVVNELELEAYLRGVVPAEVPYTWPVEALKAQSIAARSYAGARLRPGVSTYDVVDDSRSQVYRGSKGETAQTDAAIAATAGVVLKSGSAIVNALFHSTGGGATEHNENVFVSSTGKIVSAPVSYLRGSMDRAPDGTAYDAGAPLATWRTNAYTKLALSGIFATDSRTNVGELVRLDLSRRGVSGRLISVTLVGASGTKTVSGDVFVAVFNAGRPAGSPALRSTLFDTKPIP